MRRMRYDFAAFHINALGKMFALPAIPGLFHGDKSENFSFRPLFNYWEVKR